MTNAGCRLPLNAKDQYCDDENNNFECNFDGGACCNNDASGWNNYCIDCECLEDLVDQTTNPALLPRETRTEGTQTGKIKVCFLSNVLQSEVIVFPWVLFQLRTTQLRHDV